MPLTIHKLPNTGDARGQSFALADHAAFLKNGAVDIHAMTVLPGKTRGNHYHVAKNEILLIMPGCAWTLYWDDGEGTAPRHETFTGETAVAVCIGPGASHAITNTGQGILTVLGLSDKLYDPANPDAQIRNVLP